MLGLISAVSDKVIQRRADRAAADKRGLLLVSSGGLGDTALFSLMVARFRQLVGAEEPVWIIVRAESAGLSFLFPDNVTLIPVEYRRFIKKTVYRLDTCKRITALGARIAVSTDHLRLPTVDDVMVRASGAEKRYALSPRSWPKHDKALQAHQSWYTDWIEPDPAMAHRLIRWWELANGLLEDQADVPRVKFDPSRLSDAPTPARPEIILHPFSAIAEREVDPRVFIELADAFGDQYQIVMTAGPNDLARAPRHQALADHPGVEVDTGDLQSKAARLRNAALVVSVDTSIMHLAVGAGAPTLCLASAAHVVDSIPYDSRMMPNNVTFMVPEIDCAGCLGQCIHPLEDGRYRCLGQLTTDNVLSKAGEILAAPTPED